MKPSEILVLAYNLSVLNYYLGLVLYASPLPAAVKRFGARISYHGLVSALLVLLYWSIVYGVELLFVKLGLSWASLKAFFDETAGQAAMIYGIALAVGGFRSLVASKVPKHLSGVVRLLEDTVYRNLSYASFVIGVTEAVVKVIARFVYQYWTLLLALGILLYSLPAGLGRRAGASLIAATIILYLGLPLLPAWVHLWTNAVIEHSPVLSGVFGAGSVPLYWLWGTVYDRTGQPVKTGVVEIVRGGVVFRAGFKEGYYNTFGFLEERGGVVLVNYSIVEAHYSKTVMRVVPDECDSREPPPEWTIAEALISLIQGRAFRVEYCRVNVRCENLLAQSRRVVAYWDKGVNVYYWILEDNGKHINLTLFADGTGWVRVCSPCSLNHTVKGGAAYNGVFGGCMVFTVNGDSRISVNGVCVKSFRTGSPYTAVAGLASFLLHEVPLAFNIYAIAYASAIWSYLGLLSMLIYGFGRVFGESVALPFRIRY